MSNAKISQLAALASCDVDPTTDVIPIVDTGSNVTKKITAREFIDGATQVNCNCYNVALGSQALSSNTTGSSNVAIGHSALFENTTGTHNVAVGSNTLLCNNAGGNVAVGRGALENTISGCLNVAVGCGAAACNTTGCFNVAVGTNALAEKTSGNLNTAIGHSALRCSTAGAAANTALGAAALFNNTTGSSNLAVGDNSLYCNTSGCNNIAIGEFSGTTGLAVNGLVNITTECHRIVMGNNDHTCAQIKIAWTATSDCRDKTCFQPIVHGLNFVRAMKPTEYQFKKGGRDSEQTDNKPRYGFLAQDILALEGNRPVIISTDDPEKLQYTEAHLIPVLVKAIQELAAEVDALKNA